MKSNFFALALAATAAVAATAPVANAMDQGHSALSSVIANELRALNVPTDGVHSLSVSQLAVIKDILSDSDDHNPVQGIRKVLQE